jgi:hypothetical protein
MTTLASDRGTMMRWRLGLRAGHKTGLGVKSEEHGITYLRYERSPRPFKQAPSQGMVYPGYSQGSGCSVWGSPKMDSRKNLSPQPNPCDYYSSDAK